MAKVEIGPPASREEIDGFIVETHQFVLGAWAKQELRKSPLAEASTVHEWTMEPRPGCKLTVESRAPMYLPPEAVFKDYSQGLFYSSLPLRLDLPKGRSGLFNMLVNNEKTQIFDAYPEDAETLSLLGLLKLLNVVDAEEAYSYVAAQAKTLEQPTKTSRMIRMKMPMDHRWPDIIVSDEVLTAGNPGHVGVKIDYYDQQIGVGHIPARLMFKGNTGPQSVPEYLNTFSQDNQNTLSRNRILELQEMVKESVDGVYGHGCYYHDREVGGPFFSMREEFLGIDAQPSIAAREGYQYAHEFPGVHGC